MINARVNGVTICCATGSRTVDTQKSRSKTPDTKTPDTKTPSGAVPSGKIPGGRNPHIGVKGNARLARTSRIAKRKDISRLQRLGNKIYTRGFILAYKNSIGPSSRIAITVSKKVDKRAVVRNTVKRRLREVFRTLKEQLSQNIDLVIIARKEALECNYDECARQISSALRSKRLLP